MTGFDPDFDGIMDDFVTESGEGLEIAIDDVLSLEQGPDQEAIDRIFRVVHTIKGTAGMLNLTGLSRFVHCLEDTCSDIRSGDRKVDKRVTDGMLKCLDYIRTKLDVIGDTHREDDDFSWGEECLKTLCMDFADQQPSPPTEAAKPEPPAVTESGTCGHAALPSSGGTKERPQPAGKPLKTLIVEDDFMPRKLLYSFLSRFSACHVAKDGCEAIQAVTESYMGPDSAPFSLIFMDIRMPIIDGLLATRAIRAMEQAKGAEHGGHKARIFIASSEDDSATMHAAVHEYGADLFLNKPLDLTDLKELLIRHSLYPSIPPQAASPEGRSGRPQGTAPRIAPGPETGRAA